MRAGQGEDRAPFQSDVRSITTFSWDFRCFLLELLLPPLSSRWRLIDLDEEVLELQFPSFTNELATIVAKSVDTDITNPEAMHEFLEFLLLRRIESF